jgi:hypothetical protein
MSGLKEVLELAERLVRRLQMAENLMRCGLQNASHGYQQAVRSDGA